jgi:hypothetical protein
LGRRHSAWPLSVERALLYDVATALSCDSLIVMTPDAPRRPPEPPEEEPRSVNIAAILLILALVIGGAWVFTKLGERNQIENCIASGRHDCIDVRDFKPTP